MIVRSVSPSLKAGSNVACDGHFTIGQDITVDESTDCAAQGPFTIEAEINASVTDWVVVVESFGERCASPTPSR